MDPCNFVFHFVAGVKSFFFSSNYYYFYCYYFEMFLFLSDFQITERGNSDVFPSIEIRFDYLIFLGR